jgi:hypothetical protein
MHLVMAECLGGLFQRVAAVDHRRNLPGFQKPRYKQRILQVFLQRYDARFPASALLVPPALQTGLKQLVHGASGNNNHAVRFLRAIIICNRVESVHRQDPIVLFSACGEILPAVVDDMWSAPIERTMSRFRELHTPVASAPKALEICTAKVPTPPEAPRIRTAWPG